MSISLLVCDGQGGTSPWKEEIRDKKIMTARISDSVLVPIVDLLVEWDQPTATHSNTQQDQLQRTATHHNTLQHRLNTQKCCVEAC